MTKKLNNVEKALILEDFNSGMSQRKIALKRQRSRCAIQRIIEKYQKHGSTNRKYGSGRSKLLSSLHQKFLMKLYKKDHFLPYSKMSKKFQEKFGVSVSASTISRFFKTRGITSYHAASKPLLSDRNILRRKNSAERFLGLSREDVEKIIFSDETKFNLKQSDGIVYVHRNRGQRLLPENVRKTFKHGGGNVMAWGCISSKGVGTLEFIDYTMDAGRYKQILANNLKNSAAKMGLNEFVFMQDNDPKHTSKLIKAYLSEENIDIMDWPAQSPDLNPIEHIWALIKSKLANQGTLSKQECMNQVTLLWNSITPEICKKYCDSFQKRVYEVYKAKGHHTSY